MARVRSRHTGPEMRVRRLAHQLGYRYRLHRKDLPGAPDLVFPRLRLALFVHGCFWHRHEGCRKATMPKSHVGYWAAKFLRNVERDKDHSRQLALLGWTSAVIWECETTDLALLRYRLENILKR